MTPLDWIKDQQSEMTNLVLKAAAINSGSGNLPGLRQGAAFLLETFQRLEPDSAEEQGVGENASKPLLVFRKRAAAQRKIFLFGHLDTVYGREHPFQQVRFLDENRLHGPGVCDMKGGLIVLLHALQAFEHFTGSKQIGWTVVINSDEEIGSPWSRNRLAELARNHWCGLGFEPALPNGALASERRGSGVFTLQVHGRAAHSGRNPHQGRNALFPLANFILHCRQLNEDHPSSFINPAIVSGGATYNTVPDLATCQMNVRTSTLDDETWFQNQVRSFIEEQQSAADYRFDFNGEFASPPKPKNSQTDRLIELAQNSAKQIDLRIHSEATGGTCDGNRLAAAGLPNLDNLGVRGDHIHSPEEFVYLDSLVERAQLVYLMITALDRGEQIV